jgi:hypothetical protein
VPQFRASLWVLLQTPLQLVRPAWHESWHVPLEQSWPAGHAIPQAPQFWLSLVSLTHVPEQLVRPA